ncbi:MAG: ABC transporter permease [Woeseiaceae bacterium]
MKFVLSSMRKDLARWWQDRTAILIWLGIPFLVGGMITTLMDGGDGAKPHGVLLLVDQDDSFLSGLVAGAYTSGELGELISVEKVSLAEGNERINAGEGSGLLIIPEGFGDAFLNEVPVTLTLKTNPSQTILPGIITDVTEILLDAGFYTQRLFGAEIKEITSDDGGGDNVAVAVMATRIDNKVDTIAPHLFPPAIDLEIVPPPPSEPRLPLALMFLPGIIMMAILFAANSLAADYWVERQNGTLRRLVFAPGRLTAFVTGKALAVGIVIGAIVLITMTIGFLYHDIAWAEFPPSLIWLTVSGVGIFAWFGALQMLFATQRTANLLTSILLFPLLMAGGSFFPLAVLPDWIAAIGRLSPNGFVVDRMASELVTPGPWSIDFNSWLIVLAMTASGLAICAWRLRSGFARS